MQATALQDVGVLLPEGFQTPSLPRRGFIHGHVHDRAARISRRYEARAKSI